MPKVTWLLPVKNGMPYLSETLASLAAQTYRDFQMLAWDDGSTDGSIEELRRWIPNRLPGQAFTGQSRGVGGALRELVEMSDTEFCARIDADDICRPDRLELQVSFLLSHPEIALVGSNLRIIDEKGLPTGDTMDYPLVHDDILHSFLAHNSIGHPSVLCRRSALLAVGNYDANAILEDYDLWLRLAQRYKLENLPDYLVDYRIHPQSVMSQIKKTKGDELLMGQTFAKHATPLFGLTPAEAEHLREKRDPLVIARAWKIARHLSRTQGGTTWARMRSPSLIRCLRSKTSGRDLVSRFGFALLD